MRTILRRRPSPAMVVACIALAVALGGTSYAAIKLPANSVGTKQLRKNAITAPKLRKSSVGPAKLKKNAVTSPKVRNNAITGADVNEATLSEVPSAATATNATTANNTLALGGIGPSGYAPRFFARVAYNNATPTIIAASPGVTTHGETGMGFPHVVFPQSMNNCAVIGNASAGAGNQIVRRSTAVIAGGAEVQLKIIDDTGAAVRSNFDVIAVC